MTRVGAAVVANRDRIGICGFRGGVASSGGFDCPVGQVGPRFSCKPCNVVLDGSSGRPGQGGGGLRSRVGVVEGSGTRYKGQLGGQEPLHVRLTLAATPKWRCVRLSRAAALDRHDVYTRRM